jgi:hypothetical protein
LGEESRWTLSLESLKTGHLLWLEERYGVVRDDVEEIVIQRKERFDRRFEGDLKKKREARRLTVLLRC